MGVAVHLRRYGYDPCVLYRSTMGPWTHEASAATCLAAVMTEEDPWSDPAALRLTHAPDARDGWRLGDQRVIDGSVQYLYIQIRDQTPEHAIYASVEQPGYPIHLRRNLYEDCLLCAAHDGTWTSDTRYAGCTTRQPPIKPMIIET